MRGARDGGTSRSGAPATQAELNEIEANPDLARAYVNSRPGTLALLRATNDALHRVRNSALLQRRRGVLALVDWKQWRRHLGPSEHGRQRC